MSYRRLPGCDSWVRCVCAVFKQGCYAVLEMVHEIKAKKLFSNVLGCKNGEAMVMILLDQRSMVNIQPGYLVT